MNKIILIISVPLLFLNNSCNQKCKPEEDSKVYLDALHKTFLPYKPGDKVRFFSWKSYDTIDLTYDVLNTGFEHAYHHDSEGDCPPGNNYEFYETQLYGHGGNIIFDIRGSREYNSTQGVIITDFSIRTGKGKEKVLYSTLKPFDGPNGLHLKMDANRRDSAFINGRYYYNVYHANSPFYGESINFNKEFGIISLICKELNIVRVD